MKSCCGILLFLIFVSCQSVENKGSIVLDLNDTEGTLEYSSFVDSVSYITLRLDEDMYIGKIERIYQRGGFYYVWGSHRSGIYIFDGKCLERGRLAGMGYIALFICILIIVGAAVWKMYLKKYSFMG